MCGQIKRLKSLYIIAKEILIGSISSIAIAGLDTLFLVALLALLSQSQQSKIFALLPQSISTSFQSHGKGVFYFLATFLLVRVVAYFFLNHLNLSLGVSIERKFRYASLVAFFRGSVRHDKDAKRFLWQQTTAIHNAVRFVFVPALKLFADLIVMAILLVIVFRNTGLAMLGYVAACGAVFYSVQKIVGQRINKKGKIYDQLQTSYLSLVRDLSKSRSQLYFHEHPEEMIDFILQRGMEPTNVWLQIGDLSAVSKGILEGVMYSLILVSFMLMSQSPQNQANFTGVLIVLVRMVSPLLSWLALNANLQFHGRSAAELLDDCSEALKLTRSKCPETVRKDGKVELELAYNGARLQLEPGTLAIIEGPSGGGKTTLIEMLCGLRDKSGSLNLEILVDGTNPNEKLKSHFYYVPSAPFSADMPVLLGSDTLGDASSARFRELLKRFGLEGFERRSINSLSRGETQRVSTAAALASNRPILIFDEVTSGLDGAVGNIVMSELRASASSDRRIILVVSHRKEDQAFADIILRIKDGLMWMPGPAKV